MDPGGHGRAGATALRVLLPVRRRARALRSRRRRARHAGLHARDDQRGLQPADARRAREDHTQRPAAPERSEPTRSRCGRSTPRVVEHKIPLPARWVKGFGEVQVALSPDRAGARARPGPSSPVPRGLCPVVSSARPTRGRSRPAPRCGSRSAWQPGGRVPGGNVAPASAAAARSLRDRPARLCRPGGKGADRGGVGALRSRAGGSRSRSARSRPGASRARAACCLDLAGGARRRPLPPGCETDLAGRPALHARRPRRGDVARRARPCRLRRHRTVSSSGGTSRIRRSCWQADPPRLRDARELVGGVRRLPDGAWSVPSGPSEYRVRDGELHLSVDRQARSCRAARASTFSRWP